MFFDLFIFAGALLLAALLLYLLNKAIIAMAYPIEQRYLHSRIFLISFAAALVLTNEFTVSSLMTLVDSIINSGALEGFFSVILPDRAYKLEYMLLMLYGLNFFFTLGMIVLTLIVKLFFRKNEDFYRSPSDSLSERLSHPAGALTGMYYSDNTGYPVITVKGIASGIWARHMKRAFVILWVIESAVMAVSILWGPEKWNDILLSVSKGFYLIPMAGFLITEQLQLFLEGEPSAEEAGSFGSEDISESWRSRLNVLQKLYVDTFSPTGALLYSELGKEIKTYDPGIVTNDLSNRQKQDCVCPDILQIISNLLRESGVLQNINWQNALVSLLNGVSVNIRDFFQGEFLPYLAAYLNHNLSQGKTVLILCRDAEQSESCRNLLRSSFSSLNHIFHMWDICTLREAESDCRMNILVCTYDEFLNSQVSDNRRDFTSDLFCTVVTDSFSLFSRDCVGVEFIFNMLRRINPHMQYVFYSDVDNDTLRTAAEGHIDQEILPFNNDSRKDNTGIMVWKEESAYKLQRSIGIGNDLSPYLGTALPLALLAAKHDFPQVFVIPENDRGDLTYDQVLTMSMQEVSSFVRPGVNLRNIIRYDIYEALSHHDISIVFAYDTDFNFFNTLWCYLKYGGRFSSIIHVISPSYLLRDYFAANFSKDKLLQKNNEFDALVPFDQGLKRTHLAMLLSSLCQSSMTEDTLFKRAEKCGLYYSNIEELLRDCLLVILDESEIHNVYEHFHFDRQKRFNIEGNRFDYYTVVSLTDVKLFRRLMDDFSCIDVIIRSDDRIHLPVLRQNVSNHYLEDMTVCFSGQIYHISEISCNGIYADQTSPEQLYDYFQISSFKFNTFTPADAGIRSNGITIRRCSADSERTIIGYWSSNCGNEFARVNGVRVKDLRGKNLKSCFKDVNVLEISLQSTGAEDSAEKIALTFAYMLSELSKTLFPATYRELFVATGFCPDLGMISSLLDCSDGRDVSGIVRSIIPWVEASPASADGNVSVYIIESSAIEYGMVHMLYQHRDRVIGMLRHYLQWYLTPAADSESGDGSAASGSFLNFGGTSVPEIFDAPGLLSVLSSVVVAYKDSVDRADVEADPADMEMCDFCGRSVLFVETLGDGRKMCRHCKEHQISQRDEIRSLFSDTVEYLKKGYSIKLPSNIHIRFQSAESIRRETSVTGPGRVLGFYAINSHQLWIEARGPRVAVQCTLIHELTHAWQHDGKNLDLKRLRRALPKKTRDRIILILLEGHATFVQIDAMRRMYELEYADRIEAITMTRSDEYGIGFRLVKEYMDPPLSESTVNTPFTLMQQLVNDIISGKISVHLGDEEE